MILTSAFKAPRIPSLEVEPPGNLEFLRNFGLRFLAGQSVHPALTFHVTKIIHLIHLYNV